MSNRPRVESSSLFAVRSSGSMDDACFYDYIERAVLPLYPNISKPASFDPSTGKNSEYISSLNSTA